MWSKQILFTGYELRVAGYELRVSGYVLRVIRRILSQRAIRNVINRYPAKCSSRYVAPRRNAKWMLCIRSFTLSNTFGRSTSRVVHFFSEEKTNQKIHRGIVDFVLSGDLYKECAETHKF